MTARSPGVWPMEGVSRTYDAIPPGACARPRVTTGRDDVPPFVPLYEVSSRARPRPLYGVGRSPVRGCVPLYAFPCTGLVHAPVPVPCTGLVRARPLYGVRSPVRG
jgi:hypothetical protein